MDLSVIGAAIAALSGIGAGVGIGLRNAVWQCRIF